MKVLIDENLPQALRKHLTGHEVVTAAYAGLAGYKNGELLKAAIAAGFDVLVTGDKTLQFEQNFREQKIAIVSLSANAWSIVKQNVARIAAAVSEAREGTVTVVECDASAEPPKGPRGAR